ncbi:MAG: SDR family NAD(P)-dependent oxidoreductase [Thermodesulfobacteriota bacterium]
MELVGKTILITGASKGLGRAIAVRLNRKQANLILVARSNEYLEQTAQLIEQDGGKKPLTIPCDISREEEVERMAEIIRGQYDHLDTLVNNAGIGIYKTADRMTSVEMREQFAVNLFGPFYCIKALLPLMKRSKGGYILNIGSLFSKTALADNSLYAATKYALAGFSKGLRQEMKKHPIHVGLFLPGPMKTSFQDLRDEKATKAPGLFTLQPERAAAEVEKMIVKRKKEVCMYRWMLYLLKMKQALT